MSAFPEELVDAGERASGGPAVIKPFPGSRRVYVAGSRPDVRVPMREVHLSDTPAALGREPNGPVYLYDTAGPYADAQASIDSGPGTPAPAGGLGPRAR